MDDGLGGQFVTVHDSLYLYLILSGLESSRFYRIKYAARNVIYDSGNLYECDQLQFTDEIVVLTAVGPSAPRNIVQDTSLRYRDALIYKWEAPLHDGGSKLQEYHLELKDVLTDTVVTTKSLTVQALAYKFDGLEPATDYACRVKVNNLIEESDWTEWASATTGIEPTRPGILKFDATTRTTISLSWDKLEGADTGGSDASPLEITWYHLYIDDGLNGTYTLHTSHEGSAASSLLVEYLRPGLQYRFKIQAENNIGLLSSFSTE